MTIYVDDYRKPYRGMKMSHMFSDESLAELHLFAKAIGMKREWFHDGSAPHYDVCWARRAVAIRMGAVSLPIRVDGHHNKEWLRVVRDAEKTKETGDV